MRALRRWRGHTADSGASAVEFALVVPILLLLVFGIIDYGFVFSQQSTLNNGVREGARRAVVADPFAGATVSANPRTCDGIITSIKNQLSGLGLNSANVQVKVTQDGWTNGSGCGNSFQTTTFAGNAAHLPCVGSFNAATNTARGIIVEVKYVSSIPIAFPPFPTTMTLTSKAVYRCEFNF
jgi:Flp pilus assembly protein TadG